MKNLINLTNSELMAINGGGLVEDAGYAAHAVVCGVKKAYHAAVDTVSGWFD